jgi:hypothetical protein
MESFINKSTIKYNPKKKFIGKISNVQITEINNSFSKILTINNPKSFNNKNKKYENFGNFVTNENGKEYFKFHIIQVELKKRWFDLDFFVGLDVYIYGNFFKESFDDNTHTKVIKIPSKSGYKNVENLSFITIEPKL